MIAQEAFWVGADQFKVAEGELRLLSASEVLEARREAAALAAHEDERPLCDNACLIAKALVKNGKPIYPDGTAVLNALRVEDIARLSDAWAQFNREHNPSPVGNRQEHERRKKAWSTRFMSAFNGACSVLSALCLRKNALEK